MKKSHVVLAAVAATILLILYNRQKVFTYVTEEGEIIVSNISRVLTDFMARWEGKRNKPYQDQAGKWTIGIGHLIVPTDPYYPYGEKTYITDDEIDALFDADSKIAQNCVDSSVTVPLTENQRAALVSFAFNLGCGAFKTSRLLRLLNDGYYQSAAEDFQYWNKYRDQQTGQLVVSDGLTNRRTDEYQLFMTA